MDDKTQKSELVTRVERRFIWAREETIKALTALSILAAGAIIVSLNSLKVLYDINGFLRCRLLLVLSWGCFIVTDVLVIFLRLDNGKFLLESANELWERRHKSVCDVAQEDRIERAERRDCREWAIRCLIYLSFFIGLLMLLTFAGVNLLSERSEQVTQLTPSSMPS